MKIIFIVLLISVCFSLRRVDDHSFEPALKEKEYSLVLYCTRKVQACSIYETALKKITFSRADFQVLYFEASDEDTLRERVTEYPLLSLEGNSLESVNFYEEETVTENHIDEFLRQLLELEVVLVKDTGRISQIEGKSIVFSGNIMVFKENERLFLLAAKVFSWNVFFNLSERSENLYLKAFHHSKTGETVVTDEILVREDKMNFSDLTDLMFAPCSTPFSVITDEDLLTLINHKVPLFLLADDSNDTELYGETSEIARKDNKKYVYYKITTESGLFDSISGAFDFDKAEMPCGLIISEEKDEVSKHKQCQIKGKIKEFIQNIGSETRVKFTRGLKSSDILSNEAEIKASLESKGRDLFVIGVDPENEHFTNILELEAYLKRLFPGLDVKTVDITTEELTFMDGGTPFLVYFKNDSRSLEEKLKNPAVFKAFMFRNNIVEFIKSHYPHPARDFSNDNNPLIAGSVTINKRKSSRLNYSLKWRVNYDITAGRAKLRKRSEQTSEFSKTPLKKLVYKDEL